MKVNTVIQVLHRASLCRWVATWHFVYGNPQCTVKLTAPVLCGSVLFPARPSGTVSCPICMDGYSEVRIRVLASFLFCGREDGAQGELCDAVGFCGCCRQLPWSTHLGLGVKAGWNSQSSLSGVCPGRNTSQDGPEPSLGSLSLK